MYGKGFATLLFREQNSARTLNLQGSVAITNCLKGARVGGLRSDMRGLRKDGEVVRRQDRDDLHLYNEPSRLLKMVEHLSKLPRGVCTPWADLSQFIRDNLHLTGPRPEDLRRWEAWILFAKKEVLQPSDFRDHLLGDLPEAVRREVFAAANGEPVLFTHSADDPTLYWFSKGWPASGTAAVLSHDPRMCWVMPTSGWQTHLPPEPVRVFGPVEQPHLLLGPGAGRRRMALWTSAIWSRLSIALPGTWASNG